MTITPSMAARPAYIAAATLLALAGCAQDSSTGPAALARAPSGGGGTKTSITVSAADPDTIPIDTTLTVRILGSGFAPGATVEYLFESKPTTKVRATSVTFVSTSELSTTTVVERDALLGSYSIAVASGGKRGVGVEKIEVVALPVYLPEAGGDRSTATDVNDDGIIVGSMIEGDLGTPVALRWTPTGSPGARSWQAEVLGVGAAIAINGSGDVLRRHYDGSMWRTWIHLSGGSVIDLGPGSYGEDISDDQTVVGHIHPALAAQFSLKALWRSRDGWKTPVEIPAMEGYFGGQVYAISPNGRLISGVLRRLDDPTYEWGVVWGWSGASFSGPTLVATDLPGAGRAVNEDGALAGWWFPCTDTSCVSQAAHWPAAGAPLDLLPEQGTSVMDNSAFNDINQGRTMVGKGSIALAAKGKVKYAHGQPVLWRPGLPKPIALSVLQGLRRGEAMAINNTGLAVGQESDLNGGGGHAVAWLLP